MVSQQQQVVDQHRLVQVMAEKQQAVLQQMATTQFEANQQL